jgi:hypothetical protein
VSGSRGIDRGEGVPLGWFDLVAMDGTIRRNG